MFINPAIPNTVQGTEEFQSIEEKAEGTFIDPEHTFENTLFALQGEKGGELESFQPQKGEVAEELIQEEEIVQGEKGNGSEIIQIVALPMTSPKATVQFEESILKTAPVDLIIDHAQLPILPPEDGVAQLKSQVENMPQPEAVSNVVLDSVQTEEGASSISNIHSVLQPVQSEIPETVDKPIVDNPDPRVQLGDAKTPERTKVTIDAQLDQANFQLGVESSGKVTQNTDDPSVLTTAAFMHSIEEESQEEMLQRQLKQQFRQIETTDPLDANKSQALQEFSQNMKFDASINPSGKTADFETEASISKNAVQRNIPEIAEIFTSTKKEELIETSQASSDFDTNFDHILTESRDKTETAINKEIRPVSELNTARTVLKDENIDLDQIMSKVNMKDDGPREVTLQLTPQELGQLKMKIRQEGNEISVEMIVANPEVKQILEANLPELRARFLAQEDASFDQLQFAVDVEQHQFSESGQSPEQGDFQEDYLSNQQEKELEANVPVSEQYRRAGYNSGVSVYV